MSDENGTVMKDPDEEEEDEEIRAARGRLDAVPQDHVDRAHILRDLASLLVDRNRRDEAIQLLRQALDIDPGGPYQAMYLSELAYLHLDQYKFSGVFVAAHLEDAVRITRRALDVSCNDEDRAVISRDLSQSLNLRFKRTSMRASIEDDIRAAGEEQVDDESGGDSSPRFLWAQALADLDEAIELLKQAINLIPRDDPDRRPLWLYEMGLLYAARYDHSQTRAVEDLELAIEVTRESLEIPDDAVLEVEDQLGTLLGIRYQRTRETSDIEESITLARGVLARVPRGHSIPYLRNLARALLLSHQATGSIEHLDESIEVARPAAVTESNRAEQLYGSELLTNLLCDRYGETKTRADLDEGISMARKVANLKFTTKLGISQRWRPFESLFLDWWHDQVSARPDSSDLARAMEQPARIALGDSTPVESLTVLRSLLLDRHLKTGNLEDLVEIVQVSRNLVDMMPTPPALSSLGSHLMELFSDTEDQAIADEALKVLKQLHSIDGDPCSLPRSIHLSHTMAELSIRSLMSGDAAILEEAIALGTQELELQIALRDDDDDDDDDDDSDDQNRAAVLHHLGHLHFQKFSTTGARNDIDNALKSIREASTALVEDGNLSRGHCLSHYSTCLFWRHRYTNSATDLDEAIRVGWQAVEASSEWPFMKDTILNTQATALYQRYLTADIVTDLEEAIRLGRQAVEREPRHISHSSYFVRLGSLLCERHVMTENLADLEEAIKAADMGRRLLSSHKPPHPDLARVPCQLPLVAFIHLPGKPQDNVWRQAREDWHRLCESIGIEIGIETENPNKGSQHMSALVLALSLWYLNGEPVYELSDVHELVRIGRRSVDIAKADNIKDLPWHLCCLAIGLRTRFRETGSPEDLTEMISLSRQAVDMAPKDHRGLSFYLTVHGTGLCLRYMNTGRLPDLYECIQLGLTAWSLASRGGDRLGDRYNQVWSAGHLASWFGHRYLREGSASDLRRAEEFWKHYEEALSHVPDQIEPADLYSMHLGTKKNTGASCNNTEDKRVIPHLLYNGLECESRLFEVACQRYRQYRKTGRMWQLSAAILLCRHSVDATPLGHEKRPQRLELLGKCCQTRYSRIRDAATIGDVRTALAPDVMEDLVIAIRASQEVIDTTSSQGDPLSLDARHRLGPLHYEMYLLLGDPGNLKMALIALQESADATPRGDPLRPVRLGLLGKARKHGYETFNKAADLEAARECLEEAIDITPRCCPSRVGYLKDLAAVYHTKHEYTGGMNELEMSLQRYEEALEAWPDKQHGLSELLGGLGRAYVDKYKVTKAESDFEKSVQNTRKALDSSSEEASMRIIWLVALADIQIAGYSATHSTAHLNTASQLLEEAADAAKQMPPGTRREHVGVYRAVGDCYRRKYDAASQTPDLEAAISFLREGFYSSQFETVGETTRAISNAQALASALIIIEAWGEALAAVSTAVSFIPSTIPRSLDVSESQACRSKYSSLATDGAALCLSAGKDARSALELLEEGRGLETVALNEQRINAPLMLRDNADKQKELLDLFDQLDISPSEVIRRNNNTRMRTPHRGEEEKEDEDEDEAQDHHQSALPRAAQRLAAGKRLDEFILDYQDKRPTTQSTWPVGIDTTMLNHVTAHGPIVVVNVSYRCDAILIPGVIPTTLPLPKLSRESIQEEANQGSITSSHVLEWLWDTVAGPVLDALGYTEPPCTGDPWPRIWWIPTGALSRFPLHAAGWHLSPLHKTVMDRIMSSYSLSVRALNETKQLSYRKSRAKAKATESNPRFQKQVSALMVAMEETPDSSRLDYALEEIREVSALCKKMSIETLQPEQRTRRTILSHLRDCEIFHFAGHGFTDPRDPAGTHLRLQDCTNNPLTVADLVAMNLRERIPFLAYLSACGTGRIKDAKHLDESFHLINACQLAGFLHVIGTLCEVNDETCVDIAKITYEGIRDGGMTDDSVCRGLHNAVRGLRDRWRDGLTGTQRYGEQRRTMRRVQSSFLAVDEADDSCMSKDGQSGDRLARDAIPYDEEDEISLKWVPYVHYGC